MQQHPGLPRLPRRTAPRRPSPLAQVHVAFHTPNGASRTVSGPPGSTLVSLGMWTPMFDYHLSTPTGLERLTGSSRRFDEAGQKYFVEVSPKNSRSTQLAG